MMDLNQVAKELKSNQAILLDVREQNEWNEGHLQSAQHLPLSQLNEGEIPLDLPAHKTIYTHCRKGGRAEIAANILKQHYPHVIPLKYPFEDLKKAIGCN